MRFLWPLHLVESQLVDKFFHCSVSTKMSVGLMVLDQKIGNHTNANHFVVRWLESLRELHFIASLRHSKTQSVHRLVLSFICCQMTADFALWQQPKKSHEACPVKTFVEKKVLFVHIYIKRKNGAINVNDIAQTIFIFPPFGFFARRERKKNFQLLLGLNLTKTFFPLLADPPDR